MAMRPRKSRAGRTVQQNDFDNPELVFGIVGPIGIKIDEVVEALSAALKDVKYAPIVIHLTKHIKTSRINVRLDESSLFKRYRSLIKYADRYRGLAGNCAALAGVAIQRIRAERLRLMDDEEEPALGTAYIVRQFKRPEEVELMRRVYGEKFVLISAYGSEAERRSGLIEKIQGYDLSSKSDAECEKQAIELIETDNNEVGNLQGQRVSEAFPLGDVFVDGMRPSGPTTTIQRFVRAFFGDNRMSPTRAEYGLYIASAAALRSVDLSRQVGAAIFSRDGEVIALGCNEVPQAKGGTYWTDDDAPTYRDIDLGLDTNQKRRREIFYDLIERMAKANLLSDRLRVLGDVQKQVQSVLSRKRVQNSQLMDIIEFGRMIHAEMGAISDAARLGRPTKDAILYSTTFPCHLCAKHIVAAGIARVVFLEPYPKSYAEKLHWDSITFEQNESGKVIFQPFIGISPRRYRSIFGKGRRKDGAGKVRDWQAGSEVPCIQDRSASYIGNELAAVYVALGRLYAA